MNHNQWTCFLWLSHCHGHISNQNDSTNHWWYKEILTDCWCVYWSVYTLFSSLLLRAQHLQPEPGSAERGPGGALQPDHHGPPALSALVLWPWHQPKGLPHHVCGWVSKYVSPRLVNLSRPHLCFWCACPSACPGAVPSMCPVICEPVLSVHLSLPCLSVVCDCICDWVFSSAVKYHVLHTHIHTAYIKQ